jgi:membrane protease YdiL (CAAX protease family)
MEKADSEPKQTTPTASGPSPITAIVVVIAAYFGASIAGELLLYAYGWLRHWNTHQLDSWITNSTYAQFANTVLVYGLMAAAIYWFMRRMHMTMRSIGAVWPRFKDLGVALLGAPVYIIGYVVLLSVAKVLIPSLNVEQQQQLGFQPTTSHIGLILTFISLVVLPPLVEEFIMRGFLFTSLLRRLKVVPSIVITSIIFASAHLQFGSDAPLLWVAAIDTFMLSLVLCYMRYKTGSLWPGIFLHALKNCVAFLSIFIFHLT